MLRFFFSLFICCNALSQLFAQGYTSHTTSVNNQELTIYQEAFFYNNIAQYYFIDSIYVDRKNGNITVELVYDVPTMTVIWGFSSRLDTIKIDSISSGLHRLVVKSINYYDSVFNPNTGLYVDTFLVKDADTSYFQILSNPEYNLSQLEIYPNPARDEMFISGLDNPNEKARVKLIDSKGLVIVEKEIDYHNPHISLAGIPSGVYVVQIKLGEEIIKRKLRVE